VNRFIALRELVDRIEMRVSPETSERLREGGRRKASSDRARRRARARHGAAEDSEDAERK
jgi:hypothetical protein